MGSVGWSSAMPGRGAAEAIESSAKAVSKVASRAPPADRLLFGRCVVDRPAAGMPIGVVAVAAPPSAADDDEDGVTCVVDDAV